VTKVGFFRIRGHKQEPPIGVENKLRGQKPSNDN